MATTSEHQAVKILAADPDLARGIPPAERAEAARLCTGRVVEVPVGEWERIHATSDRLDLAGLLVTDGILCREVSLHGRHMLELLGPGDVVVPPAPPEGHLRATCTLTAVRGTRLIALGPDFARAAARWPSLNGAILRRLEHQRRRLATTGLIGHLSRVNERILGFLWHIASEWGESRDDGVAISFGFTHEMLGQFVGARRPTASLAIRALQREGLLERLDDGGWLLPAGSKAHLATIAREASAESDGVIGRAIALREQARETCAAGEAVLAQADEARRRTGRS